MSNQPHVINISITFRHTDPTEPIREYANEKIRSCLEKFVHRDTEAHLVLSVEKTRHIAEVNFNCDGANIKGKEESDNMYASIDTLVSSLSQQLRKHKEKLTKHH